MGNYLLCHRHNTTCDIRDIGWSTFPNKPGYGGNERYNVWWKEQSSKHASRWKGFWTMVRSQTGPQRADTDNWSSDNDEEDFIHLGN
jgi:hypothetical protein